jgi:hypothetical protein
LQASAKLAAAIKRLLMDLRNSGTDAARERLTAAVGTDVSANRLSFLLGGLTAETLRDATERWLPESAGGTLPTRSGASMSPTESNVPAPPGGEGMSLAIDRPIRFDPAGTWFRDDTTLSIRYRPAAHADPVMGNWLEFLATIPDLAQRPLALAMFKELTTPTAPGLCASCHSVEHTASGGLKVNWRAYDRTADGRTLTRFSHGPHLILPQLADCTHCHAIDDTRSVADSYAGWNPQQFTSEFGPLTKRQCADCHTAKVAGDRCQQCHNYHVDGIESWRLRRSVESAAP